MKPPVGTRAWMRETGGVLTLGERHRLIAQAMLMCLAAPARWRRRPEADRKRVDPAALHIPTTADAQHALAVLRAAAPPWLVNHSVRSYLWGNALAHHAGMRFDAELLFVACAFHDLGLVEADRCGAHCAACYAVTGARAAEDFAEQAGWPAQRRHRLVEAISLHLNPRVGPEYGAEAHLLHAGAMLDLLGQRRGELHADDLRLVLHAWPRLGLAPALVGALREQARTMPGSRAELLIRLGLDQSIMSGWVNGEAATRCAERAGCIAESGGRTRRENR